MPQSTRIGGSHPSGLEIAGVPLAIAPGAKVFYVHDNDSTRLSASDANLGLTADKPVATIDAAINLCTADAGDIILVLPGHTEAVTANSIDADIAGISIIGMGVGDNRPVLTYGVSTSLMAIGASNVLVKNLVFQATVTVVAAAIDVETTNDDVIIEGCRFVAETLGTDEFNDAILIKDACDRFIVRNCVFDMDEAAAQSAINIAASCLGGTIEGNVIQGDYAVANIEQAGTACELLIIRDNLLINGVHGGLNTLATINLGTGTSAIIMDNVSVTDTTAPETDTIVADTAFLGDNPILLSKELPNDMLAEGGSRPGLQSFAKIALIDDATATVGTVTGTVDIYGAIMHAETGSDANAIQVALASDCTDENFNVTIVAATECQTMTVIGDTLITVAPGDAGTISEVGDGVESLFATPVRVPAGTVQYVKAGTAGALIMDWTIYYVPVTSDGAIT